MKSTVDPPKYKYIDVMRGIAILLVITVHTGQKMPGLSPPFSWLSALGQMGVQLFFVASALTLYLSASGRGELTYQRVKNFYIRRYFRIAPLYYFGIIFYTFVSNIGGGRFRHAATSHHVGVFDILANVFLIHGLYPPANDTVVPGGWSIGTEILFYALFPLIFRYINSRLRAVQFIAASLLINLAFQELRCFSENTSLDLVTNPFWYYLIITQLPVFGCGILLFFKVKDRYESFSLIDLLTAFALFVIMAFFFIHIPTGLVYALIPTLAGLSFLFLGKFLASLRLAAPIWNIISEIGKKSYSMYIFHFIFAWGTSKYLYNILIVHSVHNANAILLVAIVFNTCAAYLLALLSSRFIEETGIATGKRLVAELEKRSARPSSRQASS